MSSLLGWETGPPGSVCLQQGFSHLQKSSLALSRPSNPPSNPCQNLSSTKLVSLVMLFPTRT